MRLDLFDYPLPEGAIAQAPLPRGTTRLLAGERASGRCRDAAVADLPALLPPGTVLVLNDTRVFPARLHGELAGGGKAEVLLTLRLGALEYLALARPGRKMRPGARVRFGGGLEAEVRASGGRGERRLRFSEDPRPHLDARGRIPLPPYIRRPDGPEDREWYQTVYAREEGSVAAPTAGLHFTPALLSALGAAGVEVVRLTLHVGVGTFRPIAGETLEGHRMDPERFRIPAAAAEAVNRAKGEGRRVVAVGTTATRTLEASALEHGRVTAGEGETGLFITPGYEFRVLDGLMTNFHQPRSTPLVLTCAFGGRERVLAWYNHAISAGYRFLSYGDATLIL
jgi:S-adenosylmethionine:tRNA ribosyltransferase-isomerase